MLATRLSLQTLTLILAAVLLMTSTVWASLPCPSQMRSQATFQQLQVDDFLTPILEAIERENQFDEARLYRELDAEEWSLGGGASSLTQAKLGYHPRMGSYFLCQRSESFSHQGQTLHECERLTPLDPEKNLPFYQGLGDAGIHVGQEEDFRVYLHRGPQGLCLRKSQDIVHRFECWKK